MGWSLLHWYNFFLRYNRFLKWMEDWASQKSIKLFCKSKIHNNYNLLIKMLDNLLINMSDKVKFFWDIEIFIHFLVFPTNLDGNTITFSPACKTWERLSCFSPAKTMKVNKWINLEPFQWILSERLCKSFVDTALGIGWLVSQSLGEYQISKPFSASYEYGNLNGGKNSLWG